MGDIAPRAACKRQPGALPVLTTRIVAARRVAPAYRFRLTLSDLPPSELPNFYFTIGHEERVEWRGSTSWKRSSASFVKRRSCWRREELWRMRAGGSALPRRATDGARNKVALQHRQAAWLAGLSASGPGSGNTAMAVLRSRFAPPTASHGGGGNLALTINADHSVGGGHHQTT